MSDWQKILHESIDTLDKLATRFGDAIDVDALKPAFDNFQMRITPAALEQIKEVGDPMWNQYVPTVQELDIVDGVIDSLDEDGDSPVPNITHRYPDRALFLVSPVCATYCRFCTRRRKVGDPEKIPAQPVRLGVRVSGGAYRNPRCHPLGRRSDDALRPASRVHLPAAARDPAHRDHSHRKSHHLASARAHHARVLRDGAEVPSDIHEYSLQPSERAHSGSVAALGGLADAGVPLGCQTVLLRGVNDDPQVMKELMQKLLKARVRPYYIYMADQVAGGEHFRTQVEKGLEIVKALRGWTSGLAVPHFVIDAPGGGGKVPLLPEYVEEITEDEVIFRNYEGKRFVYKQPRQGIAVSGCGDTMAPAAQTTTSCRSRSGRSRRPAASPA